MVAIKNEINFDYALQVDGIDYGFVNGNSKIVFIKTGLGGSCFGYEDRYLNMALRLKDRYGCSVIVASNPNDNKNHVDADRQIIEQYTSDHNIDHFELFFFGHSNGCIKGLELTESSPKFRKMILVNMPLMINFHKTKRYVSKIPDTHIVAVYGELDPSYSYTPFLQGKFENLSLLSVPQADHNFKGFINEFMDLIDLLLT